MAEAPIFDAMPEPETIEVADLVLTFQGNISEGIWGGIADQYLGLIAEYLGQFGEEYLIGVQSEQVMRANGIIVTDHTIEPGSVKIKFVIAVKIALATLGGFYAGAANYEDARAGTIQLYEDIQSVVPWLERQSDGKNGVPRKPDECELRQRDTDNLRKQIQELRQRP